MRRLEETLNQSGLNGWEHDGDCEGAHVARLAAKIGVIRKFDPLCAGRPTPGRLVLAFMQINPLLSESVASHYVALIARNSDGGRAEKARELSLKAIWWRREIFREVAYA